MNEQMTDYMTQTVNAPERIKLEEGSIGGHAAHWPLLSSQPQSDVPKWLQIALDNPEMPLGISEEADLPADIWLINSAAHSIQVAQIIRVNEQQQPVHLITAFPVVHSPYSVAAKIKRIAYCESSAQAILNLHTTDGASIYAFDNLYAVNQKSYTQDKIYNIQLGGFAYSLEKVNNGDTIIVDDPAAIHHHRALNDILAKNNGIAPLDLQEQIAAWQAQNEDDKAPVTLDLSKMVAYLYGDTFGQEDEAWFQGEILGISSTDFMNTHVQLLDVSIIREPDINPVIIRLAYLNNEKTQEIFNIGDYIRGNIWIQANIYATKEP